MKRIVLSTFSSALNHINAPHNVRLIPFHAIIDGKSMLDIAGFFANFFDIKPIMWLDKKEHVTPYDKIHNIERSINHMAKTAFAHIGNQNAFIYLVDTSMNFYTSNLKELLNNHYGLANVPVISVSTVSLANHGSKGVGLGVYYDKLPKITKHLNHQTS